MQPSIHPSISLFRSLASDNLLVRLSGPLVLLVFNIAMLLKVSTSAWTADLKSTPFYFKDSRELPMRSTRLSDSRPALTCFMRILQVFYPDADDVTAAAATCDPWHGRVADILSHNDQGQGSLSGDPAGQGEQGVQADPYGCGGLWERFLVHWQPNTQVGLLAPDGWCFHITDTILLPFSAELQSQCVTCVQDICSDLLASC